MIEPDYINEIVPEVFFKENKSFAEKVIKHYEEEKDKALSWYCPKKPFVITMPKLTDNAFLAKRILRENKKTG